MTNSPRPASPGPHTPGSPRTQLRIAAVCCTFRRPELLGQMIRCFERQTYENRRLVILDDAGQYPDQPTGDRWRVVSTGVRFDSLGQKRNAAASLIDPDTDVIAPWDDDDLYLPHALKAQAETMAVSDADWIRPSVVLDVTRDGSGDLIQIATNTPADPAWKCYHAAWAFSCNVFREAGGYPPDQSNGEDAALAAKLSNCNTPEADPIAYGWKPYSIHRTHTGHRHLSGMGPRGWHRMGRGATAKAELTVYDPPGIDLDNPNIRPGVTARPF